LALAMLSIISTWMLLSNIGGNLSWVTYWESDIPSPIYINNYRHRKSPRNVVEGGQTQYDDQKLSFSILSRGLTKLFKIWSIIRIQPSNKKEHRLRNQNESKHLSIKCSLKISFLLMASNKFGFWKRENQNIIPSSSK
jgi:hypothetical protein